MSLLAELVSGALLALVPQDLTVVADTTVHVLDGRFATKAGPEAQVLRLPGGHCYPGLHDAHAHLLGLGTSLENVDLVGVKTFDEVLTRVVARAKDTPKGEWILGRGWDQNLWPTKAFPTHDSLSAAMPDHPVWLTRVDGHAALANAKAMELGKLTKDQKEPAGGEIIRDAQGVPTGVLVDSAMHFVGRAVPGLTEARIERALLAAQSACLAAGLTCVQDAGVEATTLAVMKRLWREKRWKLRVYVMLGASELAAIKEGPWQTPDLVLVVRAVKGYVDGALGSYGAALLEAYSDRADTRGRMPPLAAFKHLAQLCALHGFQLCTHAIGDRANREVLDVYESVSFAAPTTRRSARWRIEHAQVVAPADFDRFASLSVIASMQPTHLTSDMPWAPVRLGEERVKGAYAWRSFLERKVPLAFGSDFPVESHDPRRGLYAAVTTRPESGGDELRPEQKLSRQEAITAFTETAAYAAFAERELGSIAPGFRGDLTIFDRDLAACPERELLEAKVLATVIGGEVVYRAPAK